ncbi:hypothetical protein [Thermosipho sp. 1074]|uniref:hypothetical protein n=1 Tax=Thermosipho sp. 1074 TaxID=1643331 RepID=UPI0009865509|nr:hypothetical protein [Thermosipho sp. 1074]OOC42176.1 hypothetical protein XO08_07785 [Thermosipho sp. 1074]
MMIETCATCKHFQTIGLNTVEITTGGCRLKEQIQQIKSLLAPYVSESKLETLFQTDVCILHEQKVTYSTSAWITY